MIKFILIIIGLYVIISNPALILIGGAAWLTWLLLQSQPKKEDSEVAPDLPEDKGFDTYEEREEKIMSGIKFKEGYKDDPKWQALAKKVGIHVEKAKELGEAELRAAKQSIKDML